MEYKAKTLTGATKRVRQLKDHLSRLDKLAKQYKAQRDLMAKLAADTPQFDNPIIVWEAQTLRDRILRGEA